MTRTEVRLAGFGGQGVILAGYLLGKAATLYDGREALFTQVYGPEARGGACNADVVLADEPIDFPEVTRPAILAVMSQEAGSSFLPTLAQDGVLLFDPDLVTLAWDGRQHAIPATRLAEQLGRRIVANMVLLGCLSASTEVVSLAALEEAVRTSVRPQTVDLNLRALRVGFEAGARAAAPAPRAMGRKKRRG